MRQNQGSKELGKVAAELDDEEDVQVENDSMGDKQAHGFGKDVPGKTDAVADPDDEATRDSVRVRVLPSPNPPSRQEALEHHNCTHVPD